MDEKTPHCYRCKYFDRFYTKEVTNFRKTKYGLCYRKGTDMQSNDSCEQFVAKKITTKCNRLLALTLNDILTQITVIRQIVEEETDARTD